VIREGIRVRLSADVGPGSSTRSSVYFESKRSKTCRPNPSTALEKISNMIPHLVDFLIKYNDCAIKDTDKKMFPIVDSLTPARRSVCRCDISCSTTAAASGSKSASFHAREVDRDPVVFSMVDLISQSGAQPKRARPASSGWMVGNSY